MHHTFLFLLVTLLLMKNTVSLVTRKHTLSIKHFLYIGCALRRLPMLTTTGGPSFMDPQIPLMMWVCPGEIMGGKIFTVCPRHDPFTQNIYFPAGEWSVDVFLENVSSHFTSCFPTYALITYAHLFRLSDFPFPILFPFFSSPPLVS